MLNSTRTLELDAARNDRHFKTTYNTIHKQHTGRAGGKVAQAVDVGLFFLALPESPLGSRLLKHALFFSVPIDPSPHAWLLKRAMRAYRLAVASRCLGVPRHALMPSRAHARSFFTEYTLN